MNALPELDLRDITVRFGGLLAADQVSLRAAPGTVTGLIGPNGAGKTTIFNAATGIVRSTGSVHLGDRRLTNLSPAARAQAGLGRTFQRMELFDTMTVLENVAMGPELLAAGHRPWTHLAGGRRERLAIARRAAEAVERCGIGELADHSVASLPTGQRRLVELARAVASPFRFLLLDEPSSGLDVAETQQFAAILADVVDRDGTGILIVEHDMVLVRTLCTYIYVLDFGRLLYHGLTADVLSAEIVQAAYLGSDAVDDELAPTEVA